MRALLLSNLAMILAALQAPAQDSGPTPGEARANVPITTGEHTWFLHVPASHAGAVEARFVAEPESVVVTRTGANVAHTWKKGLLSMELPATARDGREETIRVTWHDTRWEKDIQAFEEQDRKQPPAKGGIVFVGSSSIRKWDLDASFPGLDALNRGFGGSQFADAVYYAERIIIPYQPRIAVIYDGDNDLASGKSPEWVAADFEALVRKLRFALPKTRLVVLSIKASMSRWNLREAMQQTNALMAGIAKTQPDVVFVDADTPLRGANGEPNPAYFESDRLHLNGEGYAVWAKLISPLLPPAQ